MKRSPHNNPHGKDHHQQPQQDNINSNRDPSAPQGGGGEGGGGNMATALYGLLQLAHRKGGEGGGGGASSSPLPYHQQPSPPPPSYAGHKRPYDMTFSGGGQQQQQQQPPQQLPPPPSYNNQSLPPPDDPFWSNPHLSTQAALLETYLRCRAGYPPLPTTTTASSSSSSTPSNSNSSNWYGPLSTNYPRGLPPPNPNPYPPILWGHQQQQQQDTTTGSGGGNNNPPPSAPPLPSSLTIGGHTVPVNDMEALQMLNHIKAAAAAATNAPPPPPPPGRDRALMNLLSGQPPSSSSSPGWPPRYDSGGGGAAASSSSTSSRDGGGGGGLKSMGPPGSQSMESESFSMADGSEEESEGDGSSSYGDLLPLGGGGPSSSSSTSSKGQARHSSTTMTMTLSSSQETASQALKRSQEVRVKNLERVPLEVVTSLDERLSQIPAWDVRITKEKLEKLGGCIMVDSSPVLSSGERSENVSNYAPKNFHIQCCVCSKSFNGKNALRNFELHAIFWELYLAHPALTKPTDADVERDHKGVYPCNSISRDVVIFMEARKPVLCNNQKKIWKLQGNLHHDTSLFQGRAWIQIPQGRSWESCKLADPISTERVVCCRSGKALEQYDTLRSHVFTWHDSGVFTSCSHCGRVYQNTRAFLSHGCVKKGYDKDEMLIANCAQHMLMLLDASPEFAKLYYQMSRLSADCKDQVFERVGKRLRASNLG